MVGKTIQYTCPECGAVGASSYIPLCHRCKYSVEMKPSNNGKIIETNGNYRGEKMKDKVMVDKETLRKVIALLIAEETGVAGELNQEDDPLDVDADADVILTIARGLYLTPEFRTDIIELADEIDDEMEEIARQNQRH